MSQIIEKIARSRFVPVFFDPSEKACSTVLEAADRAGLAAFELVARGPQARQNFLFLKRKIEREGRPIALGIGTIFEAEDAAFYLENGAAFVVSPCFVEAVFEKCNAAEVPYLPGCQTISEIFNCQKRGLEMVKIFPGEVLGPAFLRAAKAVFPTQKMMVTGGVSAKNAADWLAAGADAVGIGSAISAILNGSETPEIELFELFRMLLS